MGRGHGSIGIAGGCWAGGNVLTHGLSVRRQISCGLVAMLERSS